MIKSENILSGSIAIFSRQGELFTGGPPEGLLQKVHPAARFVILCILLLSLSFITNLFVLAACFIIALIMATLSFLDIRITYSIIWIPLVILALPSWLFSTLWYRIPLSASLPFVLRTLSSITSAVVIFQSIGLRNFTKVFEWFRLPSDLRTAWTLMIGQVAAFADLLTTMAHARKARQLVPVKASVTRRQIGRQAAILFARTNHRSDQLAMAMEARGITSISQTNESKISTGFSYLDILSITITIIVSCIGISA